MTGKKVLALILSVALVASTSAMKTVKAETASLDLLYANAYKATADAISIKTQKSINTAREAVKKLPQNFDWAIGEFSKQVDKVQQPIFEKAYNSIVAAQKTPNQTNINAAKAAIDPDMPEYFRSSYSSAVDKVQQDYMKKAVDAYNKAVQSKLQVDVDAANAIFIDIRTSSSPSICNWVDLAQGLGDNKDLSDGGTHSSNYAIYSDNGTFGSNDTAKLTTLKGNILINNTNGNSMTLQNMNIEGVLSVNFGAGNITLNNVKVNGVTVTNVGSKSLHVTGNSIISNLNVQDSNNDAHIVLEGIASIINANVLSGASFELASGTTITTLNINIPITVTGSGIITTANIGASGTTIEPTPVNIAVVSGVTATVGGQIKNDKNSTVISSVPAGNTPPVVVNPPVVTPPNGGGGGGYVTPTVDLKKVSADDAVTITLKSSIDKLAFTFKSTTAGAREVSVSSQSYINGVYTLKLNAPLTTDVEYKITASKSGFNSAADSVTSKMAYKYITSNEELDRAITAQAKGENWIIKAGNYDVKSKYRFDIDSTGDNGYNRYYFPIKVDNLNIIGINNPVIYSTDLSLNGVRATQNFISVYGNQVTIDGLKIMSKLGANKAVEIMGDKGGKNFTLKNSSIVKNTLTSYNGTDKVSDYFGKQDILYPDELEFYGSIYFNGDIGNSLIENVRIENGGISFRNATSKITFNNVTLDNSTATYAWIKNYKYSINSAAEVKGLDTITIIGSVTKGDLIVTQRPFVDNLVTLDGIKYIENYDAFNSVEEAITNAASGDTIYIEPGTYYYASEKEPTAPTGVTMIKDNVNFVHADKVISKVEQLSDAIANQADGQTWVIKAGNYNLPRGTAMIEGQAGWYFPITSKNLTIIGDGNPTLTSSTYSANGAWASQNLITVFGDNVKISGVTLKTKEEANKVIEVIGDKFVLDGVTINPNTYDFAGSIYFSNPGKTATISNTILNYGRISGLTGATGATINLNNVEINFAGATDKDPTDNNVEKALWAYYRDNSSGNAAAVNATNLKVTMSNAMGSDLQDAINMLPDGTTVKLQAGTYYSSTGEAPIAPKGVNVIADGANFIKADKVINNITDLKDALKNQADGQTWVINKGTYDISNDTTTLRDNDGKIVTSGGQAGWYMPITANNLTIIGNGNPVITSSIVTPNGTWSSQSLIAVWGDKVKLVGLTITPKVEVNKSIEVIGDKQFTIENCTFTPNTIAAGALKTKGGSLYFNGVGATGTKAILIKDNSFNYTTVAFDGVAGSNITITGNTFVNIADGAYAIGDTYWGSADRTTVQYANVNINGNNFNNVTDTTKIIAARLNQTFILDASNKINGTLIAKSNFGKYINFNNLAYWAQCKLNKVVVDGVTYESPYKNVSAYVTNAAQLKDAINNASDGDVILAAAGTYELAEELNITKAITLEGLGQVTLKAVPTGLWNTSNEAKYLLAIFAGTERAPVTIKNIIIDANNKAHAVNTYNNAYGMLQDVTINNGLGAGITVNGSTIMATNLTTNGNAWGAVNVDPGIGVTTPSSFTINNGNLNESTQIWSDGANVSETATVTVNADGYNKYAIAGHSNAFIWTNKPLEIAAIITKNGVTTVYSSIQAAVSAADSGDTIKVAAGTYVEQVMIDGKNITIDGETNNGKSLVTIKSPSILGTALFTTSSGDLKPIIGVKNKGNLNINNIIVDGDMKGQPNYRFTGIGIYNSSASISNSEIKNMIEDVYNGMQHGAGIYAYNMDNIERIVNVNNNKIYNYNKGGIVINGANLTGNVTNNTVTGQNVPDINGQNGIQFGYGATGTVIGNIVTDNLYSSDPAKDHAAGILLYQAVNMKTVDEIQVDNPGVFGNDIDVWIEQ